MSKIWKKILKVFAWGLGIISGIILLVLVALYTPFVQDFIINKVIDSINSPGQLEVSAERLRIGFPLDIEAENLQVTMGTDTATIDNATITARLLPLLRLKLSIPDGEISGIRYVKGSTDSVLMINAVLEQISVKKLSVDLGDMGIKLDEGNVIGGNIYLSTLSDTTSVAETPVSEPSPLTIGADRLNLSDIHTLLYIQNVADTIDCHIPTAYITGSGLNLVEQTVKVDAITLDSISAKYVYPLITKNIDKPDSTPSTPWDVKVGKIDLINSDAVYMANGAIPHEGFDTNYIAVSRLNIAINNIHNRGPEVNVSHFDISGDERCGVQLYVNGGVAIDSTAMTLDSINVATSFSSISVNGKIGMGDFATNTNLPIEVDATAKLAQTDIKKIMPDFATILDALPPYSIPSASASIKGTTGSMDIDRLSISLPSHAELTAHGYLSAPLDMENISGNVTLAGHVKDYKYSGDTENFFIPEITLDGNAIITRGVYDCMLRGVTTGGDLALDAKINNRNEQYAADMTLTTFPIQEFVPSLDIRDVTAHISATADGIDPFDTKSNIRAEIDIDTITYGGRRYRDILLGALISGGNVDMSINSLNSDADFTLNVSGRISPKPFSFDYFADIRNIDFKALELTESGGNLSTEISGHAILLPESNSIDADIEFNALKLELLPSTKISTRNLIATLSGRDSSLHVTLDNLDMKADLTSNLSIFDFSERLFAAIDTLNGHIIRQETNIENLQQTLPQFSLSVNGKKDNIVTGFLSGNDIRLNSFDFKVNNDSLFALDGQIYGIRSGQIALDTTKIVMRRYGKYLTMKINTDNAPGTMDEWAHTEVNGFVADSKFGLFMRQTNVNGEIGYRLGTMANIADSTLNICFVPYNPVIAYKKWNINEGNIISLDFAHRHFDADLLMQSDESLIHLFTEHDGNDSIHSQEDLNLKIQNIKVADWIALNPYAPKIKGDFSTDLKIKFNKRGQINGTGTASLSELFYGKQRVGTFVCDVDVTTDRRGRLEALASLDIDGRRAVTAYGHIGDTTVVPMLIDFELSRFPLGIINPFLPAKMANVSGEVTGQMDVTGGLQAPKFNGYLRFDSTDVFVNMLASSFKFDNRNIPIDDNVITFDSFAITALNENPLTVNGVLDMRNITNPSVNLAATARNMQIVNSTKAAKGAEVYGKAYIDLNSTVIGDMRRLAVKADLSVLPQTNVTYVMTDAQNTIQARQKSDMVKFVNFADTSAVIDDEPGPTMLLDLSATLNVREGSTINADLSTDGKNKVQVKSNGKLTYTLSEQGDERMTGRLDITSGFARYTPPLMSEKMFTFSDGSYILFNGDMMNPTINIHAVDNLKANVTQTGQNSRLINFEISLDVTGTLERMDIAFDLATNDDITIQNELQSMNAEQRATQAMNLLLYGVYTGPGTKASSSLSANPLYSFLESQINTWAANNIKGVDLSFGIDQYNKTTDGSQQLTTSYSYKVSKTLFNDRFKIVVGGNYTNDAESDTEIAESLINDVSFEYSINPQGTMVLRIFRHTDYESVLEGEITQTGVGFVYKRKLNRFTDLFKPLRNIRRKNAK